MSRRGVDRQFEKHLAGLVNCGQKDVLQHGRKGVERESLRVIADGHISQRPHPPALGSALTNEHITTDYSEALIELVTPAFAESWELLQYLCDIHQFVYRHLGDELLWATSMFSVPFRYGSGWDAEAESNAEPVIVLGEEANQKFFGGANSVGQSVKLDDKEYKILGVLDHWSPVPKFYDLNNGSLDEPEEVFIPYSRGALLEVVSAGNTNCWKPEPVNSFQEFLNSECVWVQSWVELDSPAKVSAFKSWLDGYVGEQKKLGRFQRPLKTRLSTVSEWLQLNEVVEKDNSVLLGISFMFLAVCLLNTVGLLLAKFSGKVGVVSLHRALGASRKMIFRQHLVEVSLIGIAGGLLGILLGFVLLLATRQLYNSYEAVTRLDWSVGLAALGIALVAGILAGLYPTWRICRVQPAPYLKTQ